MPRKRSELSAAEYAILGLLCQQPMHGYQIAQEMAPSRGLGLVCPLGLSNVYFLLGNLERRGLIAVDHRQDDIYPPKIVLKATAAGRRAFQSWLWRPPSRLREVRLDSLLKLYFLGQEDVASILRLVDGQIEFCKRYLSEWKALAESAARDSFDRLAMQSKVAAAQGTLDWLIEYRSRLLGQPTDVALRGPGTTP
ncbi:MAG: helix-turn-helix transcriptional regulator [Dehalococcoidia bacterium]